MSTQPESSLSAQLKALAVDPPAEPFRTELRARLRAEPAPPAVHLKAWRGSRRGSTGVRGPRLLWLLAAAAVFVAGGAAALGAPHWVAHVWTQVIGSKPTVQASSGQSALPTPAQRARDGAVRRAEPERGITPPADETLVPLLHSPVSPPMQQLDPARTQPPPSLGIAAPRSNKVGERHRVRRPSRAQGPGLAPRGDTLPPRAAQRRAAAALSEGTRAAHARAKASLRRHQRRAERVESSNGTAAGSATPQDPAAGSAQPRIPLLGLSARGQARSERGAEPGPQAADPKQYRPPAPKRPSRERTPGTRAQRKEERLNRMRERRAARARAAQTRSKARERARDARRGR